MVTCATIDHFVAGGLARGVYRLAEFVERGEGFQDQQIDARFEQRLDVLAKQGARFREGGGAQRFDADAQRPDGARDEGGVAGGLARQPHARLVDGLQLVGESESRQPGAVGPESIRLENLRAGLDVLLVDFPDQCGRGEIQLVVAAVDEDALRVQHRPHGPVGHKDAACELFAKLLRSGDGHAAFERALAGGCAKGRF